MLLNAQIAIEIPMNKIEVGNTPSPNLKKVTSKIGSLQNADYKPGNDCDVIY